MMHHYLNVMVFQHKLVSYSYFMDEMSMYELVDIADGIRWADRTSWEQTRIVAFHAVAPYVGKSFDRNKFMPLPWDKASKEKAQRISTEDIERMRALSKKFEG